MNPKKPHLDPYKHVLETKHQICLGCGHKIGQNKSTYELIIYTLDGPITGLHVIRRCLNSKCQQTYGYGYRSKKHVKIYDKDAIDQSGYNSDISKNCFPHRLFV